MATDVSTGEALARLCESFGDTHSDYGRVHFDRFVGTKKLADASRLGRRHVLDIGAHWLHQALLYATDGDEVTAAELPEPLERSSIRALAEAHGIHRHLYTDLASEDAFAALPSDTFDLVLFTEILEHITFNPVAMWRALYRVMKPGARLVVTTPNVYWRYREQMRRFVRGEGMGIAVADILGTPTYGHHWKEYSAAELREYFHRLSPDFRAARVECVSFEPGKVEVGGRTGFLRHRNLYAEIELTRKDRGIVVHPAW